jgi:hypothetical protein
MDKENIIPNGEVVQDGDVVMWDDPNTDPTKAKVVRFEGEKVKSFDTNIVPKEYNETQDVEVVDNDTDFAYSVIHVKTVTPLDITTYKNKNVGTYFATMNFLCTIESDDTKTYPNKLAIICKNYLGKHEEDVETCEVMPFFIDDEFISRKICDHLLFENIPRIITEFDFIADSFIASGESDSVNFKGHLLTEYMIPDQKDDILMDVSLEQFASLAFIDSYIVNGDMNEYDLSLATAVGSKIPDKVSKFFVIDDIVSIVSMCKAEKKSKNIFKNIFCKKENNTSIGLVFKAMRYKNANERETVSLLTPFNLEVSLPDKKFKGDTVESLEEKYYGDADQYVSTLLVENIRLQGVDKEYMMIRGKNKNMDVYVFLLDASITDKLTKLIEEY